ncbi:MAG: hypothetical protein DBW83_05270 [Synechococcus sp. MED-G69]|nr:MAG: hypothetical protein DBW83_05270 [Synechococcus sp. MED-G69]
MCSKEQPRRSRLGSCGPVAKAIVADGPLTHRIGQTMNYMNSDDRADLSRITSNRAKHRMRPLRQSLSTDYKVSVNESR